MPHASLSALALVLATTAPSPETPPPVPIQRPAALEPVPEVPAPAEPEPEPAPLVQPEPATRPPAEPAPLVEAEPAPARGTIEGTATDTEVDGYPLASVQVTLLCSCLAEPFMTFTNSRGRYRVEELPPGIYTIVSDRGGPPTERVVTLAPGQGARVDFRVAPPTTTEELDRRRFEAARAHTMISIGGVSGVAGLLLLIGAAVEGAKRECQFGLDDCAAAPRPALTRGLAIGGAILVSGGAALVGLGVHRQRKLRASIAADDRSAAIVLTGRF
ncbi:MAG: carboxypeptidase-like regulatory domain-containing protein [Nannocystaceae bacterium]